MMSHEEMGYGAYDRGPPVGKGFREASQGRKFKLRPDKAASLSG